MELFTVICIFFVTCFCDIHKAQGITFKGMLYNDTRASIPDFKHKSDHVTRVAVADTIGAIRQADTVALGNGTSVTARVEPVPIDVATQHRPSAAVTDKGRTSSPRLNLHHVITAKRETQTETIRFNRNQIGNNVDSTAARDTNRTPPRAAGNVRGKRSKQQYTVELLFVVDYPAYTWWESRSVNMSTPVEVTIDQYYSYIFEAIDERFQNIENQPFEISLVLSGIMVARSEAESFWTTTSVVGDGDVRVLVNSSEALHKFQTWADETPDLPPYDHAVLFTGADLTYAGNAGNTGLAFASSMCRNISNASIVEEAFDMSTAIYATKQIARSLGVSDDMDNNDCLEFFNYVMTPKVKLPSRAFTANRWHFSTCSLQYFRDYLDKLYEDDLNCLVETSLSQALPPELSVLVQDLPGHVYTAQQQCRIKYGPTSTICRATIGDDYTGICGGLPCEADDAAGCRYILPADGTPCGNKKYCEEGKCSEFEDAIDVPESCPFGDQPGIDCDVPASDTPALCYNDTFRYTCCDSCLHARFGKQDCEYGDRIPLCSEDKCMSGDGHHTPVTCCLTCLDIVPVYTVTGMANSHPATYTASATSTSVTDTGTAGTIIHSLATYRDTLAPSTDGGTTATGTTSAVSVSFPGAGNDQTPPYDALTETSTSGNSQTTPYSTVSVIALVTDSPASSTPSDVDVDTHGKTSSALPTSITTQLVSTNAFSSRSSLTPITPSPSHVTTSQNIDTIETTEHTNNGIITRVFTPIVTTIQTPAATTSPHDLMTSAKATTSRHSDETLRQPTTTLSTSSLVAPGEHDRAIPSITTKDSLVQTSTPFSTRPDLGTIVPDTITDPTTVNPFHATTDGLRQGFSKADKMFFKKLAYTMRGEQTALRAAVQLNIKQMLPAVKTILRRFQVTDTIMKRFTDVDGEPRPDYESERGSDFEQATTDESRLMRVLTKVWLSREAIILRRLDSSVKKMRYKVLTTVRLYLEKRW